MFFGRLSFRLNAGYIELAAFFRTGMLVAVLLAGTLLVPAPAEAQPRVSSITLNSGYGSNNEWFGDQEIIATVTFSAAVDVTYSEALISRRPGLQLLIGANNLPQRQCGSVYSQATSECIVYMQLKRGGNTGCSNGSCSNVTSLKFGWTPTEEFLDTDGIVIPQNALANNGGSTITTSGTTTDVNLSHSAYSGATRKVDGGKVRNTGLTISKQTFIKGVPAYTQLPAMSRGPAIGDRGINHYLLGPGEAYITFDGYSIRDSTGLTWDRNGDGWADVSCGAARTICGTPTRTLSATTYQYRGRRNNLNFANYDFAIEVLNTPTAWIDSTATSPVSLSEDNLNGATVTVKLANVTYVAGGAERFELTAPTGVSISSVSGGGAGSTTATLTLAYDNTDFDAARTLAVKVKAAGHSGSNDLTTSRPANSAASVKASLPVAHVLEATPGQPTIVSVTPGVESLAVKWNTVTGATSYKLQWKYGALNYDSSRQTTVTAPDTSHTIPNLTGVQHTVRVIATSSKAVTPDGAASQESTGTPIVPSLSINSPSVTEGPTGASATLTYTVTLSPASNNQVTVAYAQGSGGSATSGTDYTALSSGTLTFTAGQTSKMITLSVTGDDTDEPDETVEVTLSSPTNATISTATGTGTITDDDDPPSLSINSPSVTEGPSNASATLTYTVTLSAASGKEVRVAYAQGSGGSATQGTDYTALSSGTLTFRTGQTDTTITLSVTGDDTDEPDETVEVTLSSPTNATISTATGTGTITDDDDPPSLSINSPSVTEGPSNASATLTYTVTLSAASGKEVRVAYAQGSGGSATSGTDYTALSSGTLTFTAGQTSKTITLSVTGDDTDEPDETVEVTLSSPTNATIATATGTGTITDDDDPPSLSINSPSVTEGPSNASATLTYTVTLSAASGKEVSVAYAQGSGGSATSGTDYTALSSGTLTFTAGQTSKTITLSVTGDDTDEPDETVEVTLSSPTNATIATATGTGTITDDDDPPSLSINSPSVTEGPTGASATLTYTVTLSAASGKEVKVAYAQGSGGTATSGTDYTALSSGTLTFRIGQTDTTITLSVMGDALDELNETVEVTLSSPTNATILIGTGTGTIIDDDGSPTLSIDSPNVIEGPSNATATLTYTVTLSPVSGQQVTVDYAEGSGGTATQGTDYTALSSGTLTFTAGQTSKTITLSVTGDDADEPNETIVVMLSNPTNTTISAATGTGTIADDDDPPVLSINSPSVVEGPAGASATLTYTVTLSATSEKQVIVAYAESSSERTATPGTDYTALSSGALTFTAGQTSKTITVLVAGDDADEPDETIVVTLSNPTNATISTATGTGTIADDEPTPSVTLILTPQVIDENGGTAAIMATLSGMSGAQTTVTVSAVAVSPAVAGDFTLSENAVLTIVAGATTSGGVTIAAVNDEIDSPNKQVTISGTTAGGYGAADPDDVTLTIEDDDGPPTVRLVLTPPQIPEFDGTSRVTATMNRASSAQTTVTVSAVAVSPAVAGDFTLSENAVLTIVAGATTSTEEVTIAAVNDGIEGPGKTVTVSAVSAGGNGIANPASVTLTILPNTIPAFTDGMDPQRYEQGIAISPLTLPGATGGEGTLTYSMETPPGLDYTAPGSGDGHGGVLSGTPTEAMEKTIYTVTATDGDGEAGALSFFITVVENPQPSLDAATVAAQNYVQNREIAPLTLPEMTVQGGALTYSLTPALPSGLSFDGTTRELSGTPVEAIDETEYTLTATDEDGTVETLTFTLSVVANLIPSFGDTVAVAAQNYVQDREIDAVTLPAATGGNGVLSYALLPALPSGLSFDATTRELSGMPVEATDETEFALTATDRDGDVGTLAFTISVVADSIPSFGNTTVVAQSYVLNREIEAMTLPAATGGNGMLIHVLTPALPSGLSFDVRTRELSGTPVEAIDETEYTLTALDADGDVTSLTFTLEVQEATPDFDGNDRVDFTDFLSFVSKFGMRQGDAGYDVRYDLDGDGEIGFGDFLIFAGSFGSSG